MEFLPLADSKLARRREERLRRASLSSQPHMGAAATPGVKEERKDELKREEKVGVSRGRGGGGRMWVLVVGAQWHQVP